MLLLLPPDIHHCFSWRAAFVAIYFALYPPPPPPPPPFSLLSLYLNFLFVSLLFLPLFQFTPLPQTPPRPIQDGRLLCNLMQIKLKYKPHRRGEATNVGVRMGVRIKEKAGGGEVAGWGRL